MASLCEALGPSDCISIGLNRVKAFVAGYISVNSLCACVFAICASPCLCLWPHVYVLDWLKYLSDSGFDCLHFRDWLNLWASTSEVTQLCFDDDDVNSSQLGDLSTFIIATERDDNFLQHIFKLSLIQFLGVFKNYYYYFLLLNENSCIPSAAARFIECCH